MSNEGLGVLAPQAALKPWDFGVSALLVGAGVITRDVMERF